MIPRSSTLAQVQQIEPRVNPEAISFRYIEESAAVEAYRLSVAVMQAAEKLGAVLKHGNAVGIKRNGSRPEAILTENGEEIPCDTVVVAMGPWSTEAASWLDFPVPIWPLKGQIVRLEMPGGALSLLVRIPRQLLWHQGRRPNLVRHHRGERRIRREYKRRGYE